MMKLFVIALTLAVASAQFTDCTTCSTNAQCASNNCCGSKCITSSVADQATLGAIGATCSQSTCCLSGLVCTSGACALPATVGYGCSCASASCNAGAGLTCGTGNICGYVGVQGVGAQCTAVNTCATGLTCGTDGVCAPIPIGGNCALSGAGSNYGAAMDGSSCINTAFCNATQSGSANYVCSPLIAAGMPYNDRSANTLFVSAISVCSAGSNKACVSGHCLNTILQSGLSFDASNGVCLPATGSGSWGNVAEGQNCTVHGHCASGICNNVAYNSAISGQGATHKCLAQKQIPLNAACGIARSAIECTGTAYCSYNTTRMSCQSGVVFAQTAGQACINDDACYGLAIYNPASYSIGVSGVGGCNKTLTTNGYGTCANTIVGVPCTRSSDSDGTKCPYYTTGATSTVTCQCTGANVNSCQVAGTSTASCVAATSAVSALSTKYPYGYGQVIAVGSAAEKVIGAAQACCTACTTNGISSTNTQASAYQQSIYHNMKINCATNAVSAYSTADETARCVAARTSGPTSATVFGTCPAANTGAGVSVFPSVALLVAVVAVLLSLVL